jgi:hypothetical protein
LALAKYHYARPPVELILWRTCTCGFAQLSDQSKLNQATAINLATLYVVRQIISSTASGFTVFLFLFPDSFLPKTAHK